MLLLFSLSNGETIIRAERESLMSSDTNRSLAEVLIKQISKCNDYSLNRSKTSSPQFRRAVSDCLIRHSVNLNVNLSINQSVHQSICPSINLSINQSPSSINLSLNQSVHQSISIFNQSVLKSISTFNQSVLQSTSCVAAVAIAILVECSIENAANVHNICEALTILLKFDV
jgi:hypothetical protein